MCVCVCVYLALCNLNHLCRFMWPLYSQGSLEIDFHSQVSYSLSLLLQRKNHLITLTRPCSLEVTYGAGTTVQPHDRCSVEVLLLFQLPARSSWMELLWRHSSSPTSSYITAAPWPPGWRADVLGSSWPHSTHTGTPLTNLHLWGFPTHTPLPSLCDCS